MTSHELARKLLSFPDLPVATHANNHAFMSGEYKICDYEGLKIGLLELNSGTGPQHIIIGNMTRRNLNKPNWYISKMLEGEAPEEW